MTKLKLRSSTRGALTAAACIALLAGCDADRAEKSQAQSPASPPAAVQAASLQTPPVPPRRNFDVGGSVVRPDTIDTASKIHYSLLSHAAEKEKYESTADYTKRMLAVREQVLFDEVRVGGAFAFEVSSAALRVTYDADRQQFLVEVSPRSDASHRYELIELERRPVPPNAAEVDYFLTKHGKVIEAAQVVYARVPTLKGLTYSRGVVTVAPAEARNMEHWLRVLLVGELQPPYSQVAKKYPFDADDKKLEYQNVLVMRAPAFWLVDSRNGNVLTKQFNFKRAA